MRLFIAINFNNATLSRLIALREELRSKSQSGRFSLDDNLHLTLAFIGEVSPNNLSKIKAIIDTISFEPFSAAIERVGRFKRNGGDIWWAGLREDKPLMDLQREVEHKPALCGFEMDGRDYHPHITLGHEVVTDCKPWTVETFGETVSHIDLMLSERVDGKLTYTSIYRRGK
jgi:2'-5' RNA ligase